MSAAHDEGGVVVDTRKIVHREPNLLHFSREDRTGKLFPLAGQELPDSQYKHEFCSQSTASDDHGG